MTLTETFDAALTGNSLTIKGVDLRCVLAPLPRPLKTAGGQLDFAAVILIDLHLSGGITGSSYLFSARSDLLGSMVEATQALAKTVQGMPCDPVQVSALFERQLLLFGGTGVVAKARAGLDMAMWDAIAKERGKPLFQVLGGTPDPVRTYESSGLGLSSQSEVVDEALDYVQAGFHDMKLRLGYDTLDQDIQVLSAVRDAIGPEIGLMVDYNQSLSFEAAQSRCHALDIFGLLWIEEPLVAGNLEGAARLAQGLNTPIQLGENLFSQIDVNRAMALKSCDYLMPDVMKIGGVTQWLIAAETAQHHNVPVSSHLFPEISAHLLAIVKNRHFLEYVNWLDAILVDPVQPEQGYVRPSQSPGTGVVWNEAAVARYLI